MFEELKTKVIETKGKLEDGIRSRKDDLKAYGIVAAVGAGVLGLGALFGAVKGYDIGYDGGIRDAQTAYTIFEPEAASRMVDRGEAWSRLLK